jgi:ABC-type transport system substrate-binding protein
MRYFLLFIAFYLATAGNVAYAQKPSNGLIYCSESNITSMNPQRYAISTMASSISYAIYDRLMTMDPSTKNVTEGLGSLDYISDNGKTYVFRIAKHIKFQFNKYFTPSRDLNAYDVAFTFDRLINKENPFYRSRSEFPFFLRNDISDLLIKVEAINNNQVAFHLKQPTSQLIPFLASDNSVILSKEYADTILNKKLPKDTLDFDAIGTGPYMQKSFTRERFARLVPFRSYHGQTAKLPMLVLTHSSQTNKRLTQLFTGECHVITNPTPSQLTYLEKLSKDINIIQRDSMIGTFLIFNTKRQPFSTKLTRRAIASMIDLNQMKNMVFFGHGRLLSEINKLQNIKVKKVLQDSKNKTPYPQPAYFGKYNSELPVVAPISRDNFLDALMILQKNEIEVSVFEKNTTGINDDIRIAQIIKSDLEKQGIKVNISKFRGNTGIYRLKNGNFDMAIINVFADYDTMIQPLVGCKKPIIAHGSNGFYQNFTGWCNQELDDLYDESSILEGSPEFYTNQNSINAILSEQMPVVPLIYTLNKFVAVSSVKGTESTPHGGISFIHAYMENSK